MVMGGFLFAVVGEQGITFRHMVRAQVVAMFL